MLDNHQDGCDLDFAAEPSSDDEIERLLQSLPPKLPLTSRLLAAVTSGGRDLGLAKRLRAAGLPVREVNGWESRGFATLNPRGSLTHHTAGAPRTAGVAPSLGIIINGRSDLPGPLANVYQDYDDIFYVIASGKANHAGIVDNGRVSWAPDGSGNSLVWGLEVEHPGTFPLAPARAEKSARAQAAIVKGTVDASRVIYHKEWAPSRKIDLATAPSPSAHRMTVLKYLTNPIPEEDDVPYPDWFPKWKMVYIARQFGLIPANTPDPAGTPSPVPQWAFADVGLTMLLHKILGPPKIFTDWSHNRLLGNPIPNVLGLWGDARIPAEIRGKVGSTWWTGNVGEHQFGIAFDQLDDAALEALLTSKEAEVSSLLAQVESLTAELAVAQANDNVDKQRVAELQAELEGVAGRLRAIADEIGS